MVARSELIAELIALLVEHERFWAAQDLEPDWWNADVRTTSQGRRRAAYCEDMNAVSALGKIGDPRARRAVETVRRRWADLPLESRNPLVEACDEAIKSL